jgi:copper chaperone CopZ
MSQCPVCELHAESVFRIEGMDCHEEVAILEHRLKRLTGLEALDADVVGQRLRIKYDAAKLSTARIAEAVAQTGMRAWLEHEERPTAASAWRGRLVILSGLALAIGLTLELTTRCPRGRGSRILGRSCSVAPDRAPRVGVAPRPAARYPSGDDRGRGRHCTRRVVRGASVVFLLRLHRFSNRARWSARGAPFAR